MLVSVTRLRVRSLKYLPAFLWQTFLSQRQVVRAPGFSHGKLLIDRRRTFWTVTVWQDERSMKAFRGTSHHSKVMPRLADWCDEASYAHWMSGDTAAPSWEDSHEHLVREARMSRVSYPSPNHQAGQFAKPRLTPLIEKKLKPAGRASSRTGD
jgi:hypothetical protein